MRRNISTELVFQDGKQKVTKFLEGMLVLSKGDEVKLSKNLDDAGRHNPEDQWGDGPLLPKENEVRSGKYEVIDISREYSVIDDFRIEYVLKRKG